MTEAQAQLVARPRVKRPKKPLTTAEISDRYRVHQRTVVRWIREFGLPAIRVGGRWRVDEAELEQFLTEGRLQAQAPVWVLVRVGGETVIGELLGTLHYDGTGSAVVPPPVPAALAPVVAGQSGASAQPDEQPEQDQPAEQGHDGVPVAAATMSVTTS